MPPDAAKLRALLERRCHTRDELQAAGLARTVLPAAVDDLAISGHHRILVGPLVIGLETRPDALALLAPPPRRRGTADPADLLAEFEDLLLSRVCADPAIGHTVAGLVGDHLMIVVEELRRRHGLTETEEVGW